MSPLPFVKFYALLVLFLVAPGAMAATDPSPVVLISIDGLRPGDVLEADKRGLGIPNLRRLIQQGSFAVGVRGVLPTLTYPSHTTLITGVSPARHGIVSNLTFDPLIKNQQGWFWYASDIKAETLWDAARTAHLRTVNIHWPVSVDAPVDFNLPQIWRTGTPDDRKLLRALSTPGLYDRLEAELGPYADGIDESIEADENRARFGLSLIESEHPRFTTLYYTALDHTQHLFGPGTPEAHAVLERIDAIVGRVIEAARKVDPRTVICIVSDHGFAPIDKDVNLAGAFIQAGLITADDKGKITAWEAEPWFSGGSAAIMLRQPDDVAVRQNVADLLGKLRADPGNGIVDILGHDEIVARGGNPGAAFYVGFKPGYEMGPDPSRPLVAPSTLKGMHGYFPDTPEMRSTLIIAGPGIAASHALGEVDMRDIAPTLAKLLGIPLARAEGKPLF
jgi:predicted AlkP superfamily pyrophosphatase or phosphodiesterase